MNIRLTFLRGSLSIVLALATALAGRPAAALVVPPDVDTSLAPPDNRGWDYVGRRANASAVYLGDRWVLTAFHVRAGSVTLMGQTYLKEPGEGIQIENPPGFGLSPTGAVPLLPVLFAAAAGAAYGAFASVLRSRVSGDRFILAGVAFGFAFLAWTGLFVLVVDSPRIPTLIFFVFGTLVGTTWKVLVTTSIVLYAGVAILWIVGPSIDLLVLGDRQARHVGLDTRRLVPVVIGTVGIVIGASVVLGGVVGFVGLVVPFLLRPLIGPALRILIPGSMLGGALAVVVADTVARTVAAPAEIPLGLLTAAVGGPFLAWLLLRRSPA